MTIVIIWNLLIAFLFDLHSIHYVDQMCADCGCFPSECKSNQSPKECSNCTWKECCCWNVINREINFNHQK